MENLVNNIIIIFKHTNPKEKFINKYKLLAMLCATELIAYKDQIIKLADDMKYINGIQNNGKDKNMSILTGYSMTKDIQFYDFMSLLRDMIQFIEK